MPRETARVPFSKSTASVLLDATRALAAFEVCLSHWRAMLFLPFPLLSSAEKKLMAVPYVLTGAGHQAVIIFFVLSGYLISGSVYRMMSAGTWSWRKYLTHRLVRLWIVLIPALLLGLALDGMGLYLHHAPELYSGHVQNAMGTDVVGSFTAARFFACLFFLQGITITGVFGSNSPLWSLANELWYYVMFPLGLIVLRPSFHLKARIASAALFLLIAFFVGRQILSLFPIWLLGSVLAALRVPRFRGTLRTLTILLYPFLFFFLAKFRLIPGAASDYILGVATYLFLICLLQSDYVAPTARWVTVSRLGSRFSYTLYAVHFPFLLLLTSFLAGDQLWHPTLPHLSVAAVLVPGVVVYAFAIAWLTEFRTDRVRSWVESRILPTKLPEEKTVS